MRLAVRDIDCGLIRSSPGRRAAAPYRLRAGERQAAEQVLRIIERGYEVNVLRSAELTVQTVQVAQRRKVAQRKADGVEDRDLALALPPGPLLAKHIGEFGDFGRGIELLDFSLDARLRFELDHDARIPPGENVRMQLGFAGAIAAHRVQVHPRFDHAGRQNERVAFVRGRRRDDIGAANRLGRAGAGGNFEAGKAQRREIQLELGGGAGIGVVQAQFRNAQHAMKCDGLEFALRTVADEGHDARAGPSHVPRRQCGNRRRAQRRDKGHLRKQQRIAGCHVGEHAEGGDGEEALARILRVAVDVLEGIQPPVAGRHQFDHADRRMAGMARGLVKVTPAPVVRGNFAGQLLHEKRRPDVAHHLPDACSSNVIHHDVLALLGSCG
jgi:hypothetical protein